LNIPIVISKELSVQEKQVLAVIGLLGEDATIPFIARYRKEHTGGLDEEQLRDIEDRLNYLTLLEERKATVLASIEEQGKLTPELKQKILDAMKLREVEDLYLPYKPKRKTRGTVAKAKGLEPLAMFILENPKFDGDLDTKCEEFISEEKEVASSEEALQGAKDIIAEMISDTADVRKVVRTFLLESANVASLKAKPAKTDKPSTKKDVYEIYHEFKVEITRIKPYQTLELNRGDKEKFLKVSIGFEKEPTLNEIYKNF